MNLEQYWRVLSNPETIGCDWSAYDNGWLSYFDGDFTHVFTPEGKEFLSERIEEIVPFESGCGAVLWLEDEAYQWKIYTNDGSFISQCRHKAHFLPNGFAVLQTPQGGTPLFNPVTNNPSVFLDEGKVDEVCGAGNHIIYGKKDEDGGLVYTLCEIKDDKIVKKQSLGKVHYPHFFANGSYALYRNDEENYPSKRIFEVYNRLEQKVFSSNPEDDTILRLDVGRNYFEVANTKKRHGIYSAETGECVLALAEYNLVDTYFDGGAYKIFRDGLTLAKDKWKIEDRTLQNVESFGTSGAILECQTYFFIIDTALSVTELRERALKELNNATGNKEDISYVRYLLHLLTLLY